MRINKINVTAALLASASAVRMTMMLASESQGLTITDIGNWFENTGEDIGEWFSEDFVDFLNEDVHDFLEEIDVHDFLEDYARYIIMIGEAYRDSF